MLQKPQIAGRGLLLALGLAASAAIAADARAYAPVRLTPSTFDDLHPALSPDGTRLYFESNRGGSYRIFSMPSAGGPETQISFGPGDERYPSVSPDGTRIAFSRLDAGLLGNIWTIPAAGGAAQQVTTTAFAGDADWHPAWSPDGATIYFVRRRGDTGQWDLMRVNSSGGTATLFTPIAGTQSLTRVTHDGTRLVFGSAHVNGVLNIFECAIANPAALTQLTFETANTVPTDIAPDDSRILFSSRALGGQFEIYELDRATLTKTRVTFDAGAVDPNNFYGVYAPDGQNIYFSSRRVSGDENIWRLNLVPTPAHITLACPPYAAGPFAPGDAYSLTFQICNDGDLAGVVPWCSTDLRGWQTPRCDQVLVPGNECRSVVLSGIVPLAAGLCDSNVFTFTATAGDSSLLCRVRTSLHRAGAPPPPGLLQQVTNLPVMEDRPAWTPDGQFIVYESAAGGGLHVYRLALAGGPAVPLTAGPLQDRFPQVSPDGTRVVFSRLDNLLGNLWVVPLAGGAPTQITTSEHPADADWHPVWTGDGSTIYFVRRRGASTDWELMQVPATGGAAQLLLHLSGTQSQLRVTSDGTRLVFASDHLTGTLNLFECPLSNPQALTQLTFENENTIPEGFSADDARLLVSARRGGNLELFELNRSTLQLRQLTFDGQAGFDPNTLGGSYEPGGGRILFSSRRLSGEDNLWLLTPAENGNEVCSVCPAEDPPPLPAGTLTTLPFRFCNCGVTPGRYAWCLSDERGWNPTRCDTVDLAPGQGFTVVDSLWGRLVAPAPRDTNHVRFVVRVVGNPYQADSCRVTLPVTAPPIAVTLTHFAARSEPFGLRVSWAAGADNGERFDLGRRGEATAAWERVNATPLPASAGEFLDGGVTDGGRYRYRLESVDRNGRRTVAGELAAQYVAPPPVFALRANGSTRFGARLELTLSLSAPGPVALRVFDVSGRLVRTLLDDPVSGAGPRKLDWDGRDDGGRGVGDGIYFVRALSGTDHATLRVLRLR